VTVGQLAVHRVTFERQQRRLRAAYDELVCVDEPSRLVLPALALAGHDEWPAELAGALHELRDERDAALAHTVDLLGSGPVKLGVEIDWHADFKSGLRWPKVFYQDVVATRADDDSDAKVPWELSRGHHLLALGRAAAVFNDEPAAIELEAQLRSWIAANPPGIGINWTNAMEVAIRAINWVWALAALENHRPLAADLRPAVATSLAAHARHIWHNLEGSPLLRSNHYLSDIVGLLVIGSVLVDDPLSERLVSYAVQSLQREAATQVLPDGVDFEASLSYHGLVLELLLVGRLAAIHAGRSLTPVYDQTLHRMIEASLALRHPNGRIPQFGDCDSGRVLPSGCRRGPAQDALLWMGCAMLGSEPPTPGPPHEEVAFNLGLPAWREAQAAGGRKGRERPAAESFPDAGLHVLRTSHAHLAVRCGEVGQNGNGGHSHNDHLSFELSVDGVLVVADPGTYLYTSDPRARNQFRSTAAHSTVMITGEEINPIDPGELFRLAGWARPLPFELDLNAERIRLTCAHDGYRRLERTAVVRRAFELGREAFALTVVDEVLSGSLGHVCSHLQLAPGWRVEGPADDAFSLFAGKTRLTLQPFGHSGVSVEGAWVSPRFGIREPAARLRIDAAGSAEVRFGFRLRGAEASDE
jgi:hypothetical protein